MTTDSTPRTGTQLLSVRPQLRADAADPLASGRGVVIGVVAGIVLWAGLILGSLQAARVLF